MNTMISKVLTCGITACCAAVVLLLICNRLKCPCPLVKASLKPGKKKRGTCDIAKQNKAIELTEDDLWNTAIFFPDYFPEKEYSKTREYIWYLEEATTSIDVCVYGLCFPMLEEVLMRKAKSKKVAVRVVSNKLVPKHGKMRKAGIRTRALVHLWWNPQAPNMPLDLMHHKFVVIDQRAVMAGSLNWTAPSITENWENVVITNEPRTVRKFLDQFEHLWKQSRYLQPKKTEVKPGAWPYMKDAPLGPC